MSKLRRILSGVAYVGIAGGPVLASTGVGLPWGIALGAVGALAGGILHFMDSPTKSSQELLELGKQAKAVRDAVEAAKK